jgi:hypothetical protein
MCGTAFPTQAAEMLLSMGLTQPAIETFMAAGDWAKAKKVADELMPSLQTHVDEKYKEYLRQHGDTDKVRACVRAHMCA